jgi:hypothetical protein
MNERNVNALEEIIVGIGTDRSDRNLATLMAACGVLVPSVITDEQAGSVAMGGSLEGVTGQLERIAKGEDT